MSPKQLSRFCSILTVIALLLSLLFGGVLRDILGVVIFALGLLVGWISAYAGNLIKSIERS